eukprot:EG_transcript_10361
MTLAMTQARDSIPPAALFLWGLPQQSAAAPPLQSSAASSAPKSPAAAAPLLSFFLPLDTTLPAAPLPCHLDGERPLSHLFTADVLALTSRLLQAAPFGPACPPPPGLPPGLAGLGQSALPTLPAMPAMLLPGPGSVLVPYMPEHVQLGGLPQGKWRRPIIYECKMCNVVAHSALDRDAHTTSRDHVRRLLEREQRAVLVLGLPEGATAAEVRLIFEGFRLPPDAIQYIPGLGAEDAAGSGTDSGAASATASVSGSSTQMEDDTQGPGCWHVLLNSVDDARRAAKTPPVTVGDHTVSIVLALQPHQCRLCHVTLNSAAQLQQHAKGSRHQGQLRLYSYYCTLVLTGVPHHATEAEVRPLMEGCEEVEGGLTMQPDAEGLTQTVSITFASLEDTDRALAQCQANPVVAGAPVVVARKREPSTLAKEPAPVTSGVKTSGEAHRLVFALLRDHRVRTVDDLSLALFTRLTSIFLSCTPSPLAGMQPRDRFFADFDMQAGSKHGAIPLAT